MSNDFALFLQSRLNSSRLPAKALLELGGKAMIQRVMEQFAPLVVAEKVLVCDRESLPVFDYFARATGWALFGGSRHDVLGRFLAAAEGRECTWIIRATADNPLVDQGAVEQCMEACVKQNADHCRMDGLPHGSGIEIVRLAALREVMARGPDDFEREHVCPGVWQHGERYRLVVLQAPRALHRPAYRTTIDTLEDYRQIRAYWDSVSEPDCAGFCRWKDAQT